MKFNLHLDSSDVKYSSELLVELLQDRNEDAFDYFQKAVNAGYKKAHYGLGDCYLYGWGVEQNYEKAKYHFNKIGKGKVMKNITPENINEKIDGKKALENTRDFHN